MDRARALIHRRGLWRPYDFEAAGLPGAYLGLLAAEGLVERVRRGLYRNPQVDLTSQETALEVAVRVPAGVACLFSALRFHEIGTHNPSRVWLALPRGARTPAADLPVEVVRPAPESFAAGVETHRVAGATLRVYNVVKTIADCFKYRGRIGIDVAIEALHESWEERRYTLDELYRYALINRVARVMQPYLNMLR